MSRPLRIEYENAYYHVMNRGRGRQRIFYGEEYYQAFLSCLEEAHERFGLEIHAYCLLGNHYHLLVKTPNGNLQRAMRHVGGVYTQRYNRLKKVDGALFRGRYKAILVDKDEYLLHLSKYIHKNPLEAKIVDELESYPWSSYPAYVGGRRPESWLCLREVYGLLNSKRSVKKKYQEFVLDNSVHEMLESFYKKKRSPPVLGNDDFKSNLEAMGVRLDIETSKKEKNYFRPSVHSIVSAVSAEFSVSLSAIYEQKRGRGIKNTPRKIAMYLLQRVGDYRLTEIAEIFGLNHYGGISNAIYTVRQEIEHDSNLKDSINSVINRFDP